MRTTGKILSIIASAMMMTMLLPGAVAYHGDAPPESIDPVALASGGEENRPNTFIVDVIPGGPQETMNEAVYPNGMRDLSEATTYVAPPAPPALDVTKNHQNLRSNQLYWCNSGLPVGTQDGTLTKEGADLDNQTGPQGYFQMDHVFTYSTASQITPTALDDHLVHKELENRLGDGGVNSTTYWYGARIEIVYAEEPQDEDRRHPLGRGDVVFLYCVEEDGTMHPTNVIPPGISYSEVTEGDWVKNEAPEDLCVGLYGYYDIGQSTGNAGDPCDTDVTHGDFTFYGDCRDNAVIWDADKDKTCERYNGIQVETTGWFKFSIWIGDAQRPEFGYGGGPYTERYVLNPVGTGDFPGYYNSMYQTRDTQCAFGGGDGQWGNCGQHSVWLSRSRFPPVATDLTLPVPILEDVEIRGRNGDDYTVQEANYEFWATVWMPVDCATTPKCPFEAPQHSPPAEFEPNHWNDPEDKSAIDADGDRSAGVAVGEWALYLDVEKRTWTVTGTSGIDPIYGSLGKNSTMECDYTGDTPNRPDPNSTKTCNRRDVWPTGFTLQAVFGFARDEASQAGGGDGLIDDRLSGEWVGLPDLTTHPENYNNTYNIADVGWSMDPADDGNSVNFDLPSSTVLQLKRACSGQVNVNTNNLREPVTYDAGDEVPYNYAPIAYQDSQVKSVSYDVPQPASREDIENCNSLMGDATNGWGTFVGCRDPSLSAGCAGDYSNNMIYVTPDGPAGLIRTSVKARLIVEEFDDGSTNLQKLRNAKNNPLARALDAGTYILQDVDYFGGKI